MLTNFPVMGETLTSLKHQLIDLSIYNQQLTDALHQKNGLEQYIEHVRLAPYMVGGYLENRMLYKDGVQFENRCIHLGVDVWAKSQTPIFAPYQSKVHSFANNHLPFDYGATIILEHTQAPIRFSLYGHLSIASLEALFVGKTFHAGEGIGFLGASNDNGGWPSHLHLQLIKELKHNSGDYPGVCAIDQLPYFANNCPNPFFLLF